MRWLEEARIQALSSVGLSYSDLSNDGFEMPVVELKIKYLLPLFHGDQVLLKSLVLEGRGPRIRWETQFLKDSKLFVALAKVDLVLVKKENSVSRLMRKAPAYISQAFDDLQKGAH